MPAWRVEILGVESALKAICSELTTPKSKLVEENGSFWLQSTDFDSLDDPVEIRSRAHDIVEVINGALRIRMPNVGAITAGDPARIDTSGRTEQFGAVSLRIHYTVAVSDVDSESAWTGFRSAISMSEHDEQVSQVLQLLSHEGTFADLYSAYEIIRASVGESTMVAEGWAQRTTLKRFTMTANNPEAGGIGVRHPLKGKRPVTKDPMSLAAANVLLRELADRWLNLKEHAQPSK